MPSTSSNHQHAPRFARLDRSVRRLTRLRRPAAWAIRWLALVAALAGLALAGILLGLRLAGPAEYDTRLGEASLRVEAAWHGEVEAFIPVADWGVRARPFEAPVRLHLEPRSVDRQAVLRAASGRVAVLRDAREDAEDAAGSALRRAWLWATLGALALGGLAALAASRALRTGRALIVSLALGPALLGALAGGVCLWRVDSTFEPSAFERASFYARGAELAQLLKVAGEAQVEGRYRSSVERTLSGYAALLGAGARLSPVASAEPAVLLSDLHANTLVIKPFRRLFSGRPVFFAGDLGQSGSRAEAELLVPRLAALGRPLVAVSGNHDSALLMRRLARSGALVLTERGRLSPSGGVDGKPVQSVAGLRVAGYPDPLEWRGPRPADPDRVFSFAELPNGERRQRKAVEELTGWFERLSPRPDVVVVHQNGLAQSLARAIEARPGKARVVVLTGHDHEQHVDRYRGAVVVDGGSAGAGGAFGVATTAVGVASLHFDGGALQAVDLVRVEPLSGAAQADRIIVASEAGCEMEQFRCHDL